MTISASQIKFMESEVLADTSDGGGRMSGREVIDGLINNVLPDISRMDRVYGRVQLRKLFVAVRTANQDTLLGAHTIALQQAEDPNVRCLLFHTGSHTDQRAEVRERIESYVVRSNVANFYLYGTQLKGQRAIQCLQQLEDRKPDPEQVYCLRKSDGTEQFIKIVGVAAEERSFTTIFNSKLTTFRRRVLILTLNAPLAHDFTGRVPSMTDSIESGGEVYTTQIADAARYYGSATVSTTATPGAQQIIVDRVLDHLVPAAQTEIAITDQQALTITNPVIAAGASTVTVYTADTLTTDLEGFALLYAGGPITPGSLTVVHSTLGSYRDEGGQLVAASGTTLTASQVDYSSGLIRVQATGWASGTKTLTWIPGAPVSQSLRSTQIVVDDATRQLNYVVSLSPPPARTTVKVEYRSQGTWNTLTDNGAGALVGDGSGTINYDTGTLVISCAAFPDADTVIMIGWGELSSYTFEAGAGAVVDIPIALGKTITPNSVSITWDGHTITDNGSGALVGDGTGSVDYATGDLVITPDYHMPSCTVGYSAITGTHTITSYEPDYSSGTVSLTLGNAPVQANSVSLRVPMRRKVSSYANSYLYPVRLINDDGAGNLKMRKSDGAVITVGTVNYTTGACSFDTRQNYDYWSSASGNWGFETLLEDYAVGSPVIAQAHDTSSTSAFSDPVTPRLRIRPNPLTPLPLLANSLRFTLGGVVYTARDGAILRDISPVTNGGTTTGEVSSLDRGGSILLDSYPVSAGPVTLQSAMLGRGELSVVSLAFRTAGAPVRQASLNVRAFTLDGSVITGASDTAGVITGGISGSVNSADGAVTLSFSGRVYPSSVTYSAVTYRSLPLDSSILGLDPVRLPSDGRVPIFRASDVVVISHTATTSIAGPVAGATETLARDHQAEIWVTDTAGTRLDPAQYSLDLEAGTLTWADPLTLQDVDANPLTVPMIIHDRVEDMSRLTDVQLSGRLSLQSPLTQTYPAGEAVVASAVLFGDLRSRVWGLFHQASWTGVWSDERIGSDTTAKYNDVAYPLEISNLGSIQERWLVRFNSASTFEVVGETVGVIASGDTSTDCAPINPAGGSAPYFTLRAGGWSSGWVAGNCVRFNTDGAQAPLWLVRTVLSGPKTTDNDQITLQRRGDAD